MRFFTDQYFSEEQKVQPRMSAPLKLQLPESLPVREKTVVHHWGEEAMFQRDAEMMEFERTSNRIGYVFMGGIVSVILVSALLDLFSTSQVLAVS